jgi:hypothetical protein
MVLPSHSSLLVNAGGSSTCVHEEVDNQCFYFVDAMAIADKQLIFTPTAKVFHPETILFFLCLYLNIAVSRSFTLTISRRTIRTSNLETLMGDIC